MSYSQCAIAALLVALVVGVQGHQIIYVDTENGTLNSSCWEGGLDQPCGSLELADTGAQKYNSTIAVLYRYGTSCDSPATVPISPQTLFCLPLPTIDNGTCRSGPTASRCEPTASRWNESATIQKFNSVSAQSDNVSCPPWFEPFNGTCKCGDSIDGIVECNETLQESAVLDCYCMTYSETTGTVVGACLYNCVKRDSLYHQMPKTVEELNDAVCGHLNRGGQLCGECKTNYSPPVYSYNLNCTMCSGGQYNWMKYVAIAFVPLTVFLVLVLCCRISATSPKLIAFVTFSQALSYPANARAVLFLINEESYPGVSIAVRILLAIYGFWNLDFFRTLIPHICLKVDTLQALALDYGIAFYPLALIIVTYVLIELHARNIRIIVWIWKPFHRRFARFRQQWDVRSSIIDAFATFLLLSNIKLLSVSFDLLLPTYVYNMNGSVVGIYLYYDGSIEYFGNKHLPYAILAVFVVLIFILLPILLLLLYPMRCFQRCLGHCRVRWHALHIFVDAFQGCYKDGTNGTRDCRYFAGVYLLLRPLLLMLFAITLSAFFYGLAGLVLIGVAMFTVIVQPYKEEFAAYNIIDPIFFLTIAMCYGTIMCINIAAVKAHHLLKLSLIISFLVGTLPLSYLVIIFVRWICCCRGFGQRLVQSIKCRIKRGSSQTCSSALEFSLPHRLVEPSLYNNVGAHATLYSDNSTEKFSDQGYSSINTDECKKE